MANRTFNQFQGTIEKNVVQLFIELKFNATGADPTITRGKGIESVTNYVGLSGIFEIKLQDSYWRLLGFQYSQENALMNGGVIWLNTDVTNAKVIRFATRTTTGSQADPPTNSNAFITLTLSNSSAV